MKFTGIIALFVAGATATPITLGDAVSTVGGLVKNPASSVDQVKNVANVAAAGAENATNRIVSGKDGMLSGAGGVANDAVGGLVKPVTGTAGGLPGGVLKN